MYNFFFATEHLAYWQKKYVQMQLECFDLSATNKTVVMKVKQKVTFKLNLQRIPEKLQGQDHIQAPDDKK